MGQRRAGGSVNGYDPVGPPASEWGFGAVTPPLDDALGQCIIVL